MSKINILAISDIHFGHDKNKTENIVENLNRFFKAYSHHIVKSDMIIIPGDVFDKLLSNNSRDSRLAYNWLAWLVKFCKEYGIKLRILEGTPSHDWKQVKVLDEILKSLDLKDVDYRYVDILDIERVDDLGMSILYIPDEWKPTAKKVYEEVIRTMKKHNLEKVDMVVMHGAFNYQIPNIESERFHNESDYLNITNYIILAGHVHNFSQFEKILVPGSFDRLTHADEGIKKGGLYITLDTDNKTFKYQFLENKTALEFITMEYKNDNINELDAKVKKLNEDGRLKYVRIIDKAGKPELNFLVKDLMHKYPNVKISVTNKKDEKEESKIKLGTNVNELGVLDAKTIRSEIEKELSHIDDVELRNMILEELEILMNS